MWKQNSLIETLIVALLFTAVLIASVFSREVVLLTPADRSFIHLSVSDLLYLMHYLSQISRRSHES